MFFCSAEPSNPLELDGSAEIRVSPKADLQPHNQTIQATALLDTASFSKLRGIHQQSAPRASLCHSSPLPNLEALTLIGTTGKKKRVKNSLGSAVGALVAIYDCDMEEPAFQNEHARFSTMRQKGSFIEF